MNFSAIQSSLPPKVRVVEVGPRDGLQNEAQQVPLQAKLDLIQGLTDAGLTHIEVGSFVSPKWVPQMADSRELFAALSRQPRVTYAALTPNLKGLELALEAGATEVAVFGAASERFSQKNINCSIAESLSRFDQVMQLAKHHKLPVRGYVSCVLGCPFEGEIQPQAVLKVSQQLLDMGCYEVSLGDTIGVGTAVNTAKLLEILLSKINATQLAVHFHDTYGQALANVLVALQMGIGTVDSSIAGLGGCPYAKGASGNLATEDLVYMLNGMNIDTGADLTSLIRCGNTISEVLGRTNQAKVAKALS